MKTITFKDRVRLYVTSGNGGDGCVAFRREKFVPRGGPSGGDGGRGGHVFLRGSKDADSLLDLYYRPHQKAEHGGKGETKECYGRNGQDLTILVPCGTVASNEDTGEIIGEVLEDGEILQIAKGGRGGLGNVHFATPSHQAPRESTPGEPGQSFKIRLELKLVADAALVGFPNAGKSTLLRRLTRATPKVAAYPFTTLNPVIGTLQYDDFQTLRIADIPGLIEGAHEGIGLGHDFLRHIERTSFLIYILDMAGVDGRHPADDYKNLRNELARYNEELAARPYMILANKMDLPEAELYWPEFIERTGETPLRISAEAEDGLEAVKERLRPLASMPR